LAQQSGNTQVEGFAGAARFQMLRQQPSASQEAFDLTKPLTQAQYRAYQLQNLGEMFYVCQSCGHLNLMLGEHCAHCQFAPQNLSDLQLSLALCAFNFKTTTLLQIAQQIQQGRKPHEFIDGLDGILKRFDTDQGILEKIRQNAEDDHLDFKALDRCPSCAKVVWSSSTDVCPNCHANLNRPMLLKLTICVDRLLQQLVWNIRRSDTTEFARFVILLVNLKYLLVRAQMAPTDEQRHAATELLLKISPLYAQNGGGVVWVKSATKVVSEVLNPEVHKDIGPTLDFIREELKHFLHLVSDAVSLF
jgi:rubrerythrin